MSRPGRYELSQRPPTIALMAKGAAPLAKLAGVTTGAALREVFSARPATIQALSHRGDAGLFGPESVAWKVHAHPAAVVGGLRSLIVQTLHPLVIAGVEQHSNYRVDPLGRLQRTADFIAITTFGTTAQANAAISSLEKVHQRVRGTAPDGRPYSANDPELLAWVHHVEVESFVLAYKRAGPGMSDADADRYVGEMARLAEVMGVASPITTWGALRRWVLQHPEVHATEEARTAVRFLARLPLPLAARPAYALLLSAAISLVPPTWRLKLGLLFPGPISGRAACEPAARLLTTAMGWALGPSPAITNARSRASAWHSGASL